MAGSRSEGSNYCGECYVLPDQLPGDSRPHGDAEASQGQPELRAHRGDSRPHLPAGRVREQRHRLLHGQGQGHQERHEVSKVFP